MGNSYDLIEDVWIWGRNRNIAINYRSDRNVWRRVVIRGDGCSTARCTGNGNPNFGLSVYDASYTTVENVIVMDRILDGGSPYADFGTAMHTPGIPYGGHEWLGTIALNGPDNAYYFEPDESTIFPTHTVRNCVGWGSPGGFNAALSGFNDIQNCTFFVNGDGDGIRIASELAGVGALVKNNIVFGTGNKGVVAFVPYSYVNATGTWAGGAFATTCDSGCRTTNPLTGSPPSIMYPTRIEAGSALKGTGQGGADFGATVVNRYGVDGARWGDPNYNTLSTTPLWPYPNQAKIKAQMCAGGVTRGVCRTSGTLTQYIWQQSGNPLPAGISPGQ
jgi:hypothetical protein